MSKKDTPTFTFFMNDEPQEIEIPATHETFAAHVLTVTKSRKQLVDPHLFNTSNYIPMPETHRVLKSRKYHVELIRSSLLNGKPTLIIEEDEGTTPILDASHGLLEILEEGLHAEGRHHKQYALCRIAEVLGLQSLLEDIEDRGIAP